MIAPFESVGAGGDSPLSDIVDARSWLSCVRPRRRWCSCWNGRDYIDGLNEYRPRINEKEKEKERNEKLDSLTSRELIG